MSFRTQDTTNNLNLTEKLTSPNTNVVEEIISSTESYFETKMDSQGIFLDISFGPRLFESLLLASYIKKYQDEQNLNIEEMVSKVTDEVFKTSESGLDLNIQFQLLILYRAHDINDINMEHWMKLFTGLLQEAFEIDTKENYQRKLLIFLISSLFISLNNKQVFKFLLVEIQKMMDDYQNDKRKKRDHSNNWNTIYPVLVKLFLSQDIEEKKELTNRILSFQTTNGSFFQNHTTTLIVLHVLKFSGIENVQENFSKKIKLTESYVLKYSQSGLSILPSMNHYDTVLLYSFKALFTNKLPPNRLLVNELLHLQRNDGGWGVIEDAPSDFDMTSLTLLFLHSFHYTFGGQDIEEAINRSLENYFRGVKKGGSFVTYIGSNDPLTEMTARGILIATILSDHFPEETLNTFEIVKDGLSWLNRQQNEEGYFNDQSYSYSKLYPISQVAIALYFIKKSKYNLYRDNEIKVLVNNLEQRILLFLMNMQLPDGSFGATTKTQFISEQQSTIYSLIALSLLKHKSHEHKLTFNYYFNNLLGNSTVIRKNFSEGTGPRPLRYNDLSHGPLFSLIAMYSLFSVLNSEDD